MATWKKLNGGTPIDKVLSEVFGDFHGAALTVRDAIPLYLADAAQRKRPTTIEGDTYRLAQVGEARWAGKVLGRVTSADLLAWIRERQKPRQRERRRARRPEETLGQYRKAKDKRETVTVLGASGATINRDVAIVSALFEWAIGLAYATDNPARKVETFTESKGREVYLTADEARALVGTCGPALRPIVLAALHTGMRRGELLALRWRSVDFTRGEVYVEPDTEKAGRGRTVPLTANLKAVLAGLKSGRTVVSMDGSDPVFSLSGGAPLPKTALRSMFVRGVRRCEGIPLAKRGEVSFHTLRHTAASVMVAAGVPLFDVAKVLGHSTLAVTMRYAHFAPAAGRSAIDRLGAALSSGAANGAGKARRASATG